MCWYTESLWQDKGLPLDCTLTYTSICVTAPQPSSRTLADTHLCSPGVLRVFYIYGCSLCRSISLYLINFNKWKCFWSFPCENPSLVTSTRLSQALLRIRRASKNDRAKRTFTQDPTLVVTYCVRIGAFLI